MGSIAKSLVESFQPATIPLMILLIWSTIVFLIGVGAVFLDLLGSLLTGVILALFGSLVGGIAAIWVGWNAAKISGKTTKDFAIAGALFGLLTSIVNSFLSIVNSIIGIVMGKHILTGLQGVSLTIILEVLYSIGLVEQFLGWKEIIMVIVGAILFICASVISGAILSSAGGLIGKRR